MIWQIGKNPEFIFSTYINVARWSGDIALPLTLSWWKTEDAQGNKNFDITIHFLCFAFGLEIWKWRNENV